MVLEMDVHFVSVNYYAETSERSSSDNTSTNDLQNSAYDDVSVSTNGTDKRMSVSQLKHAKNRFLAIIGTLFIIGSFSIPAILYYTQDRVDLSTLTATSNNSVGRGLLDFCDISLEGNTCVTDVINTYEALRSASQSTNKFCINKTENLFGEALKNCRYNMSYARGIVCQEVRQQYCTAEWRISEIDGNDLIDCDEYGETDKLNCSDQFGLANNDSVCLPLCRRYSQYSDEMTRALRIVINLVNILNAIGGITVLIASYWNRKKMFRYPQVLIVLNACLWIIEGIFICIGTIGMEKWNPLCSGDFLQDSFETPSVFTQMQGAVLHSTVLLYNLFWFIYFSHLFMIVARPFHSRYISVWQKSKTVHIIEFSCAVLIGTIPNVAAAATSQFHIINFPPIFVGTSEPFYFYGIILPNLVVICADLILMLCTLYKIHINYGIFKRVEPKRKCSLQLTVPEVKIFLTFCYLLVLMSVSWISATLETNNFSSQAFFIVEHIRCMSGGVRRGLDCGEFKRQLEMSSYPELFLTSLLFYIFLNLSNLPFVIKYRTIKHAAHPQQR